MNTEQSESKLYQYEGDAEKYAEGRPFVNGHAGDGYDIDEYQGVVETHYWVPDKSQPEKKVRLDLRVQALKDSDDNRIRKLVNGQNLRVQRIGFLQRELSTLRPSPEIERLEQRRLRVTRFDFEDDEEAADKKRREIEEQIERHREEYRSHFEGLEQEIKQLTEMPSFYETLRQELFVKVIAGHNMFLKGKPVDFTKGGTENEPSDAFAAALQDFIFEVLRRGPKSSRGSRTPKK